MLFAEISDAVWLAIVAVVGTAVMAIVSFASTLATMVVKELLIDRPARLAQKAQLVQIKENVVTIEKATNSMKDALVLATGDARHAEGINEGVAQQKADEAKLLDKPTIDPTPVEVINKDPVLVKIEGGDKEKIAQAVVKALDSPVTRGNAMCGVYKSIKNRTITIMEDDGTESTITVAAGASVTLDGKSCKLSDLQAGDKIECDDPDSATTVAATRN